MNGHEFEIEGEGEGRLYEGTQTAEIKGDQRRAAPL